MKTIGILGEGAWGTAVATVLSHNGHTVKLWCYNKELVAEINRTHFNKRYLPGVQLSERIQAVAKIGEAVGDIDWIFEAIPVTHLRSVLEQARHCYDKRQTWVILSKGIEQETLLFPTGILDEVFKTTVNQMVFAGPSFAQEVAKQQITAVTLAAPDCEKGEQLQKLLANDYFRPYVSTDMIGVQVGAAVKNVITLGVGMLAGAGYTDNPQAFILTRGLHEIVELSRALGGRQETVYGLSGVGDLVLTAMGSLSRNREVGVRLGKGEALDSILEETGSIPEGINTVKAVYQLMQQQQLDLPICAGIYDIIFKEKTVETWLKDLMSKPLSMECDL